VNFDSTPHERAALLLLLIVGRDAYFGDEISPEAREALDRIPTDHLQTLFSKVELAVATIARGTA
jgi:hypothetical protein